MIKPYYQEENITIYCGDCLEVMKEISDKSIDLVLTDPPYGIDYKHGYSYSNLKKVGNRHHKEKIIGDDKPFDPEPLLKFKKLILFGANNYANKLPNSKGWIVWHKRNNMKPMDASDCELIYTNIATHVEYIDWRWVGVCRKGIENTKKSLHPTQKPIGVITWLLIRFSNEGDTILDPFLGSGTTARACKDLGRKCIGIEINKSYCDISVKRLAQEILF